MKGELEREHRTRRMLNEYIVEHPGVTFNILKHVFSLNESTLRYHLNYLQNEEEIFSKKRKGLKCYFSKIISTISESHAGRKKLRTRNQERVLTLITENPGISRKELSSSFQKITSKGMSYVLSTLRKDNLIWETKTNFGTIYEAMTREKILDQMLVILVRKLLNEEIDEETFNELKKQIEAEKT